MTGSPLVLLALGESLATLFFVGGLLFIARMLARKSALVGELAYVSFVLIASNAALVVLAKVVSLAYSVPGALINSGSLALVVAGFVCLAWALWRGLRTRATELTAGKIWLTPLFINALVLGTAMVLKMLRWGRAWFWLLIGAAMVGSLLTFLQLVWRAQERGLALLALLFALSFAGALIQLSLIPSAAQMPPWIEPLCKVIAQSAFVAAAWQLREAESCAQNKQK